MNHQNHDKVLLCNFKKIVIAERALHAVKSQLLRQPKLTPAKRWRLDNFAVAVRKDALVIWRLSLDK
jgi:hypothetical protein